MQGVCLSFLALQLSGPMLKPHFRNVAHAASPQSMSCGFASIFSLWEHKQNSFYIYFSPGNISTEIRIKIIILILKNIFY